MTRILYVEDHPGNAFLLSSRLKRKGYEVLVATDGEKGIAMAQAELPSLILMDLRLPVIDGWEATRKLKLSEATRHIPIIALSAHAMSGDRQRALDAGCDDYLTKPIDLDRLLAAMKALLEGN